LVPLDRDSRDIGPREESAAIYRKNAEDCRQQAERSKLPGDRAAWLRLAEQWLKLAQDAEPNNKGS
jgi:hypothetical protein